jgi:hypothetical protein
MVVAETAVHPAVEQAAAAVVAGRKLSNLLYFPVLIFLLIHINYPYFRILSKFCYKY